jgi:hypothetical protein
MVRDAVAAQQQAVTGLCSDSLWCGKGALGAVECLEYHRALWICTRLALGQRALVDQRLHQAVVASQPSQLRVAQEVGA